MKTIILNDEILDNIEIEVEKYLLKFGIETKVTATCKEGFISLTTEYFKVYPAILSNVFINGSGRISSLNNKYKANIRLNASGYGHYGVLSIISPFYFSNITITINKSNNVVSVEI